jgi:hypothetical protein
LDKLKLMILAVLERHGMGPEGAGVARTAAERQKLWEWCPDFIDREVIYRG